MGTNNIEVGPSALRFVAERFNEFTFLGGYPFVDILHPIRTVPFRLPVNTTKDDESTRLAFKYSFRASYLRVSIHGGAQSPTYPT